MTTSRKRLGIRRSPNETTTGESDKPVRMATHNYIDPKKLAIGQRIAAARQRINLSISDLASSLGVTANAITQWETGRSAPSRENFYKVARVLQTDVEWLLTGDDPDERRRAQTQSEEEALTLLRALTPDEQQIALASLHGMAERKKRK